MAGSTRAARSLRRLWVLLRVIARGEERTDETGMGLGGDGAGPRRRGLLGALGAGARKVAMAAAFALVAALFFAMGMMLGEMGVSPYAAFSLSVVALVSLTALTGLYQAVNVLYFVRDLGYYLTPPLSATTIMWAKLLHFLGVSVLGDLIVAPIFLGCLWAHGAPAAAWAAQLLAYVLCAAAVNLALVIVCVPLMRFSRLARDKDRFSRVFGALMIVLALSVGVGSQFAVSGDGLASLASGVEGLVASGPVAVALALLCPPTLLAGTVVNGGAVEALLALLGMGALVALYAALLSVVAGRWYLEGVQELQSGASRRGRTVEGAELARVTSARGHLAASLSRDWKTLVRVPVFFNQFVLSSLLMPLYLVAVMAASSFMALSELEGSGLEPAQLLELAREFAEGFVPGSAELAWCALGVLAFALLLGFSSYSFTMAVSRDGDDFFFLRGLPMDWRSYLMAKFVSLFALSATPMLLLVVVVIWALGLPAASGACLVGVYVGATAALGLLCLGLGALFPRLSWESEAQLVKGGGATLMVFAGLLLAAVVMGLPALALLAGSVWDVLSPGAALACAIALFAAECAGLAWWVLGPCARSLSRRER